MSHPTTISPLPAVPAIGTTGTARAAIAVRVASEISTLIGRSIRLSRRHVDTLVMAMLLPLMLMALFVYVFGGALDRTGD